MDDLFGIVSLYGGISPVDRPIDRWGIVRPLAMTTEEFEDFCYRHRNIAGDTGVLWRIFACVSEIADENVRLRQRVADLEDTIEQVATGGKIRCHVCQQLKPCMCDKG